MATFMLLQNSGLLHLCKPLSNSLFLSPTSIQEIQDKTLIIKILRVQFLDTQLAENASRGVPN